MATGKLRCVDIVPNRAFGVSGVGTCGLGKFRVRRVGERDAFVACARTRNGPPVNENAIKLDLTLCA